MMKTLLAIAILAYGAVWTPPSSAQQLKTLKVSIIPIIDVAPLMVARKQGFFAQEGLQIDTSPTAGGATGIPALIGGAVDITFGNAVSTMLAAGQGLDVMVIAPASQLSDSPSVSVLIGRKGDSYKTAADFAGKTFGVNTRNGINWLYTRAWIKKRGGDPDRVTYKEVPFPQIGDAVKRRQIDAEITGEPFKSASLKDPELAIVGSPFVEVQEGLDVGQYITTSAYEKQNKAMIEAFVRALRKGIVWYNDNLTSPALADLVAEYTRLPVATVRSIKLTPMPMSVSVPQMQKTVELMQSHGLAKPGLDAGKFVLPLATRH